MVLLLFLFLSSYIFSTEPLLHETIELLSVDFKKQLVASSFIEKPIKIKEVVFDTSSLMSDYECEMITGWKAPCELTPELYYKGITVIAKKKLFKKVDITLEPCNNDYILHCVCDPLQILTKKNLQGIHFGKDKFFSPYTLQVGDAFVIEKHENGVERIKESLKKLGYIESIVTDTVKYNDRKHEVEVTLTVDKGKKSSIKTIDCTITSSVENDYKQVESYIHSLYLTKLLNTTYYDEEVFKVLKEIELYLKKEGYQEPSVTYTWTHEVESHTVLLHIHITVGKKRYLSFEGNNFYDSDTLRALLTEGGPAGDLLPPALLVQDLTILYRKKGFWNVVIEYEKRHNAVLFIINEGERALIDSVVCKGLEDTHISINTLFKICLRHKVYDEDTLMQSVEELLFLYKQAGYWDIALTKKNFEKGSKDNHYNVVLIFSTGKQRTVNKVMVKEYEVLEKHGPFIKINKDPHPTPVTRAHIQEQHDWLIDYFRKKGYPHVHANSVFETIEDKSYIIWTIDNVEKVYHGNTIVQGKSPMPYEKVVTFLEYKPGSEWKKESLVRTYSALRSLDVFKYIGMYPDQYSSQTSSQDVILHLQEDDPYEVRVRLGFQQVSKNFAFKKGSTYKAGATFIAKNVTHNADLLRVDADFTRFTRNCEVSYQHPHPWLLPISILTKAYGNKYTQPIKIGSSKKLYDVTQDGGLFSISGQYKSLDYGSNIGIEWMKIKNISSELATAINFQTNLIDKRFPYLFMEPTLFLDLLDDKINPSRGLYALCTMKAMIPLTDAAYFIKLMVEQGIFFPLVKYRDIICATRIRFGHIFNETFSKIMPTERFYLGGANSLRGYVPDACPPLGATVDNEGQTFYVPQGGKTMLNMNLEIRIPFTKAFMFAVFQDFGVLADDLEKLHDNNVTSSGFGIRYLTPIGPLRFDIGFKWKRTYPEEPLYAWFLTLGHAF